MDIRVLLVDDEVQFVELLAERLDTRGFKVQTAFTGEEALLKLQQENVDVVVLDVFMPGKDGLETLRAIKQLQPLVEVIMLTGHATVETGIEGMRLGAFDYLLKPTETEELVAKIKKGSARKIAQEKRIRRAEQESEVGSGSL
ncbi:MAG TPA: response regulator [Desulfomonilaceae bacterium]|nr:response regulator [Desulfomonilaceae bacterium]